MSRSLYKISALLGIIIICAFFVFSQKTTITYLIERFTLDRIIPEGSLPVEIQLINLQLPDMQDNLLVEYTVVNSQDEVVLEKTETLATSIDISFYRELDLIGVSLPGLYSLSVDVSYQERSYVAISYLEFCIERKVFGFFVSQWYASFVLFALSPLVYLLLKLIRRTKEAKRKTFRA